MLINYKFWRRGTKLISLWSNFKYKIHSNASIYQTGFHLAKQANFYINLTDTSKFLFKYTVRIFLRINVIIKFEL